MKKILSGVLIGGALIVTGCVAPKADDIKKVLAENPEILYDVIKKDPVKFMEVLSEASEAAKEEMQKREMQAQQKKMDNEFANPKQPVIGANRAVHGNVDAPITIVEYSDFQCPYCSRGYQTVKQVFNAYGDNVKVIYKHLPLSFHPHALIAAQYFEAIGLQSSEKAYEFHDVLFENQNELKSGGKEYLAKTAKGLGVNMKQLEKDLNSEAVMKTIQADISEAQGFGFQGTPAFLVNGVSLYGAQPFPAFKQVIDRHLAEAKK